MDEIIKRTDSQYIIIRGKGDGKEYFDGANLYGRDNDGVLRVAKTKWSKEFHSIHASHDLVRIKNILDGMHKYGEIEKEYNYVIAEIQTTTAITNYIVISELNGIDK